MIGLLAVQSTWTFLHNAILSTDTSNNVLYYKLSPNISESDGSYYTLLEVSMDKIALCKNVRVDDWTAERPIIANNSRD